MIKSNHKLSTVILPSLGLFLCLIGHAEAFASCNTISTFADGLSPVREVHVAIDGSDVNGDGSIDSPYATIGYGISQATPGSAVIIHSGTYGGGTYKSNVAGTASAPIWIGGAAGAPLPVIDGGNTGIQISRAKYVVLHDLEVQNASSNGINFDDGGDLSDPFAAHHIVFKGLIIHDIGSSGNEDGLKLSGINAFFVLNCYISRCGGYGSGIDHVGCHHGVIAWCDLEDLGANAIQCKGGSEDIEIRWCRIKNAGQRGINIGGSTGFSYFRPPLSTTETNFEARDIRVVSNIFKGTHTPVALVGCVDSVVANNTIIDPESWLLRILQETTSTGDYDFYSCADNEFKNNLLHYHSGQLRTYINIGPYTAPETFIFTNNLWYAHDNPSASTPSLPVAETDGIYGIDPLLADPAGGNYQITSDSPAFRAGLSPPIVAGDFIGTCYHDPPSIGAYEVPPDCTVDANDDGDVDGEDLSAFAIDINGDCLDDFASRFGN